MGSPIRNGEAFAEWLAQHEPPPDGEDTESATREWDVVDGDDTQEIEVERITQEAERVREDNPLANADDDDMELAEIFQRTQLGWLRAWLKRWTSG